MEWNITGVFDERVCACVVCVLNMAINNTEPPPYIVTLAYLRINQRTLERQF